MSLKLTILNCYKITDPSDETKTKNKNLDLTNDGQEATFQDKDDSNKYSVTLKSISFHKKMYAPCEIIADIQISGTVTVNNEIKSVTMTRKSLSDYFHAKQVTLAEDAGTIASNCYVHEIIPRMVNGSDARFATLKIYSPDKLWMLDKYSRSYVAKRLYNDILLDGEITDDSKNRGMAKMFTLPYDSSNNLSSIIAFKTLHTLGSKDNEYILPYLVQYNETFYDFLVRTANRWGEFLYFEGGKLNYGYTDSTAEELKNYKSFEEYSCEQGSPLTIGMNSHTVNDPSKLVTTTKLKENFVDEVTTDEYLASIKNDGEFYDQIFGEIDSWDLRYIWKKLGHLFLKNGNLYSFLLSFLTEDLFSWGKEKAKHDERVKNYKNKYFSGSFTATKGFAKSQYSFDTSVTESDKKPEKASDFYPFASEPASSGPTAANYATVLASEQEAGQNMICVDLGPNYTHKLLGSTFYLGSDSSSPYMVVEVHCETETSDNISYSVKGKTKKVTLKDKNGKNVEVEFVDSVDLIAATGPAATRQHYKIVAVKKTSNGWYPPIHENGHVRQSGPQLAYVIDNDDPTRNLRYRVKYAWQTSDLDSDLSSPWLAVANPMATKDGGAFFKYQENDQVLLNYEAGNIERPYIVGALQNQVNTVAPESRKAIQTLITPGGQTIRMSDGVGNGLFAFMGSLVPILKFISGYCPSIKAKKTKSFEGSIELTDKYGTYSIKASTDDRNVTIKSVFGDVTVNAFTGITISAPNGDVKIQGKNVSIEAGNNLTLTSGTNIKNGFLGDVHNDASKWAESMATDAAKALMQKTVSFIDLSALRCMWETFLKPIEGTLEIKSNRFLKLEAGKGSACYPLDALSKEAFSKNTPDQVNKYDGIGIRSKASILVGHFLTKCNDCKTKYNAYNTATIGYADDCKKAKDLLKTLWDKPAAGTVTDADLDFKNRLAGEALAEDLTSKKTILKTTATQLLTSIQDVKNVVSGSGAASTVNVDDIVPGILDDKLKDALKHHDHVSYFMPPGDSADQLHAFFMQDFNIESATNQMFVKKIAVSTAIKYIASQKLKPNATAPAPTDFSAANWEETWEKYIDGLSYNSGELSDKLKDTMIDMVADKMAFFSNTKDYKVWGGDNNASILMSSGNNTYMFDDDGNISKTHGLNKMKPYYSLGVSPDTDYALAFIKKSLRDI